MDHERFLKSKKFLETKNTNELSNYDKRIINNHKSMENHLQFKQQSEDTEIDEATNYKYFSNAMECDFQNSNQQCEFNNTLYSDNLTVKNMNEGYSENDYASCSTNYKVNAEEKLYENHTNFDERFNDFFDQDYKYDHRMKTNEKIKSLEDLFNSEGFFEVIKNKVVVSPAELLIMIWKFSRNNGLTFSGTSNLLNLINLIFDKNILHASRYKLDQIFNKDSDTSFHAICSYCSGYIGNVENIDYKKVCESCHTENDICNPSCENLFVIMNPHDTIKELIETNDEYYDFVVSKRLYEEGHIKDIYDGRMYRSFVESFPDNEKNCYVTTIFNIDGAQPFESSKRSVWPIYLQINELPIQDRFKNIVVCGLWFNKEKPKMSIFLHPFVEEMNKLNDNGILCNILNENRSLKVYTLVNCVDSVARALVQGIKQFNGHFGCGWCLHPGEYLGGSMRYPVTENEVCDRDEETILNLMKQSVELNNYKVTYGVKNISVLVNLKSFNIVHGFVPDYMHAVLGGVTKQVTNYLVESSDVKMYQNLMEKIKVPNQISRPCRPMSESGYWTCREWENWLLYFSTVIFSIRLGKDKLNYWTLLVQATYTLLKEDIPFKELKLSDIYLRKFYYLTEKFFGKTAMTYNIHLLLHLVRSVLDWGPLWAHSTFSFESANKNLLKSINCAKAVVLQILRQINMNHSISMLEKKTFGSAPEAVKIYLENFSKVKLQKSLRVSEITYFGKYEDVEVELQNLLSEHCKFYSRMIKDNCLYATCLKVNLRSDNSFAQLTDNSFVQLIKFIVDVRTKEEKTLCHVIETDPNDISLTYNQMRKIIKKNESMSIIPTSSIKIVCICINANGKNYLCPIVNSLYY